MKPKNLSRVVIVSARVSKVKEKQIKQRCLATGESVSDVINESLEAALSEPIKGEAA